jgi:hypothetical protein
VATRAEAFASGYRLTGKKTFVLDGHVADQLRGRAQRRRVRRATARAVPVPGSARGSRSRARSWSTAATLELTLTVSRSSARRARSAGRGAMCSTAFRRARGSALGRDARHARRGLRAHDRLPEGAQAVRRADRLVPGAEAPRGEHVRRGRALALDRARCAARDRREPRRLPQLASVARPASPTRST